MDGIHDLGGKHGFGPVVREDNEPVFHADWEPRVFTLVRAAIEAGARQNLDQFRHAIERIDPVAYLTHTYYGRWLGGVENLLVEAGVLTRAEIDTRYRQCGGSLTDLVASRPAETPDRFAAARADTGEMRPLSRPARYRIGDLVTTRRWGVPGHTRLPEYARGRRGRVVALHGGWVYPDTNAHGLGEAPQHLYSVAFDGAELWGDSAEPGIIVHLDLFEPYLEAAEHGL
jgi:nitrile hydratase subunit beta